MILLQTELLWRELRLSLGLGFLRSPSNDPRRVVGLTVFVAFKDDAVGWNPVTPPKRRLVEKVGLQGSGTYQSCLEIHQSLTLLIHLVYDFLALSGEILISPSSTTFRASSAMSFMLTHHCGVM